MTERDLERILTESVQDVHLSDTARRAIRLATKEERPVKMKRFAAIVLVLVLALTTSVGVAAELGMFDFLYRWMRQEVLPEATSLVQTNIAAVETDHVTYTVKQSAYDGKSATLLVEMRAKDENTFLITEGISLDDPYGALACKTETEMLADPRTIGEYAKENGYGRILSASMHFDMNSDIVCVDEWQNNIITVMYSFNGVGDALTLPLTCSAFDVKTGDFQEAKAKIILTAAEPSWQVSSPQIFDLPDYGIRIDGMTVTGTPLQCYWEVKYTITDAEKASMFHWFDVYASDGAALPRGVLGVGGSKFPSDPDTQRIWTSGFGAMTDAPSKLMLQVRDVNGTMEPVQMIFDLK